MLRMSCLLLPCVAAACGSKASPDPIPFGALGIAGVHQIESLCQGPLTNTDGRAGGKAADIPEVFLTQATDLRELQCHRDMNSKGFSLWVDMFRDEKSGQVFSLTITFSVPDETNRASVTDIVLSDAVDPWLKVVPPAKLRASFDLAAKGAQQKLEGPHWLVTVVGPVGDAHQIAINADLMP